LLTLSQEFAVEIINLSKELKNKKEHAIADQIKRSGTSISANIAEGNNPQSRADMISKFEIALKEASETENWLTVLKDANLINVDNFNLLHKKVIKIKILLINSIKTLKSKV
jgi:four helix bundle protein